jgi:hypothetical protein
MAARSAVSVPSFRHAWFYERGEVMKDVYFPTTAIVSLLYVIKDGSSGEFSFSMSGRLVAALRAAFKA